MADDSLRDLARFSAGSGGIGGADGGAKFGRGVSSSVSSVPSWLIEPRLSRMELLLPSSLASSRAVLSLAALSRFRRVGRAGGAGAAERADVEERADTAVLRL